MLNGALVQGLPLEWLHKVASQQEHGAGKGAHGKFSVIVAACMASTAPVKAHRDTLSSIRIRASLSMEASRQGGEGAGGKS
jgi:hypothetical protein